MTENNEPIQDTNIDNASIDNTEETERTLDEESTLSSEEESSSSTSSEEEESSSDEESDDDEEEVEPRFKYNRITQLPVTVFNKDPVSTCLASETFFAFATHNGVIHLTKPDFTLIRSYRAHRASILGLATDGTYLASASIDGTVVIGSVLEAEDISASNFKRPVHSVALDPNYKSSKTFISGGMAGDVILSERGWLGNRSDTILQKSDDPVIAIYWIDGLIIWMNDSGINIYNQHTRKLLMNIPRPENSPRADLYKPRICTPESNRIYIAWADRVWNLKVTVTKSKDLKALLPSSASMILSSGSSMRSQAIEQTITVESELQVDCLIAGIAAFKDDTLMMLSYLPPPRPTDSNPRPVAPSPELRLVDLQTGGEVYGDELALKSHERLGMNDYHLCQYSNSQSTKYLIISAKDGIVATERDLNDKIEWLVDHKKLEDAWNISANVKTAAERYAIGLNWVESLVDKDDWVDTARVLELVQNTYLETDNSNELQTVEGGETDLSVVQTQVRDNWNEWGFIFTKAGHTDELAPKLPADHTLQVDSKIYESFLLDFIEKSKIEDLITYLETWPIELYDFNTIKRYIEDLLQDKPEQKDRLRKTLSGLYILAGDPVTAVHHLLLLRDPSVLDLVSKYHLLRSFLNQISEILTINLKSIEDLTLAPLPIIRETMSRAISIVVQGRHEVTPDDVVSHLTEKKLEVVSFLYLEQLNLVDSFASQKFGDLQARLYAEFDRPKLIGFLKRNNNYNLEKAAQVCESLGYIPELVYILGKVGQNKRALKLVLEDLQDPDQAIEFAKQQNDQELWDDLLDYCLTRPLYLKTLLDKASGAVPPAQILARIPAKLAIPGLKDTLLRIFTDHEIVLALNQGILEIVNSEAQILASQLRAARSEGTILDFAKAGIDFSQTVVVLPDGSLQTEVDLIGETWAKDASTTTTVTRSVRQKVKHLAFIKRKLQLLLSQ